MKIHKTGYQKIAQGLIKIVNGKESSKIQIKKRLPIFENLTNQNDENSVKTWDRARVTSGESSSTSQSTKDLEETETSESRLLISESLLIQVTKSIESCSLPQDESPKVDLLLKNYNSLLCLCLLLTVLSKYPIRYVIIYLIVL